VLNSISRLAPNTKDDPYKPQKRETISRSNGVTPSEQYLKKLCDRSFLSLWSYPGVFRDQGRTAGRGDGKEVSDLLVVFENHIIIFSTNTFTSRKRNPSKEDGVAGFARLF
jgi:hypothetical protein